MYPHYEGLAVRQFIYHKISLSIKRFSFAVKFTLANVWPASFVHLNHVISSHLRSDARYVCERRGVSNCTLITYRTCPFVPTMQSCGQYYFRFDWTRTWLQLNPHIQKHALNYKPQLESVRSGWCNGQDHELLEALFVFPWRTHVERRHYVSSSRQKGWLLGNVC